MTQTESMRPVPRRAWTVGVALGLVGAALDFYSGYLLLSQSMSAANDMAMVSYSQGLAWGVGISALGVVLAVTSVAFASARSRNMKDFGALMVVYGAVMLFIGASMYTGLTAMTTNAFIPALGMLAVGALMLLNGGVMRA